MNDLTQKISFPELVLGFVSPIGTDLKEILESFSDFFNENGYNVILINVTDQFKQLSEYIRLRLKIVEKPLFKRYNSYISYGNQLRGKFDDDSILAILAIENIIRKRLATKVPVEDRFRKNVYLVHQFKRKEEIELLRSVYGSIFFQISAYSRRGSRVDYLSRKFAEDQSSVDILSFRSDAEALIDRDESEKDEPHGQRVGRIFHDADLILNTDISEPSTQAQISRFCEILFSSNKITPTKMEYGMFAATSAALRSSDLSRQVGAAIFSQTGEILTVGSNEVPKAEGGTYWPDDEHDAREFVLGFDSNQKRKKEILGEIIDALDL